jgi:hypothetical protein
MSTQAMKPSQRIIFIWAAFCLMTTSIGCTREKAAPPSQAPALGSSGDSRPAFAFDWKHAQALTLSKFDPKSGDHWMARVERQQEKPQTFFENDPWLIQAYSGNDALPDRLANRNYILHLLDTLGTFHTTGTTELTPQDAGLTPPRYALEWKAWNEATGESQTFQVQIGSPTDPAHPANEESYGIFPPSQKVVKVDGAAVAMLDYLKSFSELRQDSLSPLTSDDVDEIEIDKGARKIFYAQREGERWTNEVHKPWKENVGAFLDRITHLRIAKFLDSDAEITRARGELGKFLLEKIILKDRAGNPTVLRFAQVAKRPLADVSTRGSAVFELYPGALDQQEPR